MKTFIISMLFTFIYYVQGLAQVEAICDAPYNPDIPGGYAIAVLKDGKVEFKKAYGYANSEHDIPFTSSTVFDYASVAKQFTGFGIALLVDQGKLALEDDIRRYLPEVPDFGTNITIRHLLYHTSGIRDWVGLVKLSGRYKSDVITDDFLMELVTHQKDLNFVPGERFQYSNTGYFLLARIIAKVTDQSFREWTRENIFLPLGMSHTHFSDDYSEIIKGRASSYRRMRTVSYANSPNNLISYGSSSLFSTLDDMTKWMFNFKERGIGGDAIWQMMLQKGRLNNGEEVNYGFGISFGEFSGKSNYGHGGSWSGCVCQLTYFPEEDFGFLFISNRNPSGVYVDDEIFQLYLGDEPSEEPLSENKPVTRTEITMDPLVMEEYVGYYYEDNRLIKTEIKNNNLVFHFPWESNVEVLADSADRFFLKGTEVQYLFSRDESGKVIQMSIVVPNGSFPHGKINPEISDCERTQGLCGEYYSEELKTFYTIRIKDGRLIADHLHNEDVELLRMDENHYRGDKWWFSEMEIIRDENNQVEGFELHADADNIQHLVWIRQ